MTVTLSTIIMLVSAAVTAWNANRMAQNDAPVAAGLFMLTAAAMVIGAFYFMLNPSP